MLVWRISEDIDTRHEDPVNLESCNFGLDWSVCILHGWLNVEFIIMAQAQLSFY